MRLRSPDDNVTTDKDGILYYGHSASGEIDVATPQGCRLPPPQSGVGEESNESPMLTAFLRKRM